MSRELCSQSPVALRWDSRPENDKENIQRKPTLSELQKKFEKLHQGSAKNSDTSGKMSRKFDLQGAVPKHFGDVTNGLRPPKVLRRGGTIVESSTKHPIDSSVYMKTKFQVFDDVMIPCLSSTTIQEYRQTAFQKAKDFFEQSVRVKDANAPKTLRKLQTIKENAIPHKRNLKHHRINQLITENACVADKVTPHEIPPPQLEKVKVLHKLATADEEFSQKLPSQVNYKERDFPYLNDFILYQQEKDHRRKFDINYRQLNASIDQRHTVVQFIIRLCSHNALPSYVVYQTVRIFDDMLQAKHIALHDIQLVMIASLWIVLKKDYIAYRIPSASKMASFSDGLYREEDVLRCEVDILKTLNFEVTYPEPISLLCVCMWSVKNADLIDEDEMNEIYYCGGYMLDLATMDEELITQSAILLAISAAELAMTIVLENETTLFCTPVNRWRMSRAWLLVEEEDIFYVRNLIIRDIIESCYKSSRSYVIYKKYSRSRYGKVATTLIQKIQKFLPPQ